MNCLPVGTTATEAQLGHMYWEGDGFPESRWGRDRAKDYLGSLL